MAKNVLFNIKNEVFLKLSPLSFGHPIKSVTFESN